VRWVLLLFITFLQIVDVLTTWIALSFDGVYEANLLVEPFLYEPWLLAVKCLVLPALIGLAMWREPLARWTTLVAVIVYIGVVTNNLVVILRMVA